MTATPASAVRLAGVSKCFRLPRRRRGTLGARGHELLRAVDDVSLEVPAGEFFGIVGRNGSGKSTLLKCLAGIYAVDAGTIEIAGRLSPFIELGVGFNPELSGRDNAIINAIMLGLSRSEAERRYRRIVEFAELEDFMEMRLKNYSSGMHVRLAFSVAIQVDADILLIDEVLAVGDSSFQQKCFEEFARLKRAGRTIIFVTHDMAAVQRFCDRAMLMEHGQVVEIADAATIARRYNELNFGRELASAGSARRAGQQPNGVERDGSRSQALGGSADAAAELVDASFRSPAGERIVEIAQGGPCCVELVIAFKRPTVNPQFAIALRNDLGQISFATSTERLDTATGSFAAGEVVRVHARFDKWLAPGRYRLLAAVAAAAGSAEAHDLRHDIASLIVHAATSGGGVVDLPHRFEIERI